jgi:hypothetical protein
MWKPRIIAAAFVALLGAGCAGSAGYRVSYVAATPPPPPRRVVVYERPGYVRVDGRWAWTDQGWVWIDGYYTPQRTGYVWVEGRWYRDGNRWVWRDGYWRTRHVGQRNRRDRDRDNVIVPARPAPPAPPAPPDHRRYPDRPRP